MTQGQLVLVGLGPGGARYLTAEARQVLRAAPEVWLRTRRHPLSRSLLRSPKVRSFDEIYERAASFTQVYQAIADRVAELGRRPEGVVYAVPGHPLVGEQSVRLILDRARDEEHEVRIVAGVSFLEPVFSLLRLDPLQDGLQIIDAGELISLADGGGDSARWLRLLAAKPLRATKPVLVCQLYDQRVAAAVKLALLDWYPEDHEVSLVYWAGVPGRERTLRLPLRQLDRAKEIDHLTCLYLPALGILQDLRSFDSFRHIVARLRAPGGCPWDREQSHQSLKPYVIEETYEVVEALDDADPAQLEEELGDLLLQIVLHAQLAAEDDEFAIGDVLQHISSKLIRRHPHVFAAVKVNGTGDVLRNWERIKQEEKGETDAAAPSLLGGVPREMPSLAQAGSIQRRVADVGFDWSQVDEALAKVAQEAGELRDAADAAERRREFGDLLFALVSAGRHMGLEAEEALRLANQRFVRRFRKLEAITAEQGIALKGLPVVDLERLWQRAKALAEDEKGSV